MEIWMNIDRAVLAFAGLFILLSLGLAQLHSPLWLLFTALVGLVMLQSAFTRFCPLALILPAAGLKPGSAFD
jgi:hypothetical protein